MSLEIWKTIEEFPDYSISSNGRIRNEVRRLKANVRAQRGSYIPFNSDIPIEPMPFNEDGFISCPPKGVATLRHYTKSEHIENCVPHGPQKNRKICRLVAEAFIRPLGTNEIVEQIDGNVSNNCVHNLRIKYKY